MVKFAPVAGNDANACEQLLPGAPRLFHEAIGKPGPDVLEGVLGLEQAGVETEALRILKPLQRGPGILGMRIRHNHPRRIEDFGIDLVGARKCES